MDPSRRRWWIIGFGALYISGQAFGILSAGFREDKRFGFRMFSESSSFRARLRRELRDGSLVDVPGGEWEAVDRDGKLHRFRWRRWVRDNRLDRLDEWTPARTGIGVTLKYFQGALDYVSARIPEDDETWRLVLVVEWKKAGTPGGRVELRSRDRDLPPRRRPDP